MHLQHRSGTLVLFIPASRSNTISALLGALSEARTHLAETMSTELLVDFKQFWSRLSADIRSAQQSVFVQTFAFEGDAVGKQLSAALVSSPAADKRILADSFTRIVLSDRFRYSPANFFDQELRGEARATDEMFDKVKRAGVK